MSIRVLQKSITHSIRLVMSFMLIWVYSVICAQDIQEIKGYPGDPFTIIENLRVNHAHSSYPLGNLVDQSKHVNDRFYFSGRSEDATWSEGAYLEVDVKSGVLDPSKNEDIFVMIRRYKNPTYPHAQPTMMEVKGSVDGNNWETIFYAFFLFRGPYTTEYSEAIPVAELAVDGHMPSKLRFEVVTTNNNRRFETNENSYHPMGMTGFDVIKIERGKPYNSTVLDRTHLNTDHLKDLHDFSFVPSRGVVDPRNRPSGWSEITEVEKQTLKDKDIDIELPDFTYLTSTDSKYDLDPGQKRQRTHTIEHIVYAIPGDMVMLYPYYGMSGVNNYQENFSHWYNFKTGGRLTYEPDWGDGIKREYELLDFLNDPSQIQITNKAGYFGGQSMNIEKITVNSPDEYAAMVNKLNSETSNPHFVEITADLDFSGKDVPMINSFNGVFNGNGHRISNLTYDKDGDNAGLICQTTSNTVVENIVIDRTCRFVAKSHVGGVIGQHSKGSLTLRNIHTEAAVYGTAASPTEQAATGLLGYCNNGANTPLLIEDCYVGGKIGNEATNHDASHNAALIGWWQTNGNNAPAELKNVIVACEITGYDGAINRKYIRSYHSTNEYPVSIDGDGSIHKGIFSFDNCYGNLDSNDLCWYTTSRDIQVPNEQLSVLKEAGWTNAQTPPMETESTVDPAEYPYTRHYSAGNAEEYIKAVNAINARTDRDTKVYFYLSDDIDFSGYAEDEVPILGETESCAFSGFLNGMGHTIKNLKMTRSGSRVGIVGYAKDGIRIENLILDESCWFEGTQYVALVGEHLGGSMKVCSYKTEATFIGISPDNGKEQCAAGILGINKNKSTNNVINLSDIYIGGTVGNPDDCGNANTRNAALIGWFENEQLASMSKSYLYRILVECTLNHPENVNKQKYIRHRQNGATVTENPVNHRVTKANFEFDTCYGQIDSTDDCWRTDENETVLQREGWTDSENPPMDATGACEEGYIVKAVNSVADYRTVVNSLVDYESTANICISIKADLDFENKDDIPLIGATKETAFRGLINGNGHTIKNLTIKRTTSEAGLVCWGGDGIRIENLKIDGSCLFEGTHHVGLVGSLTQGYITVRNVKTEATVRGTRNGEHAAGGIVGFCGEGNTKTTDNVMYLTNIYIGGIVGDPSIGSNNGAVSGWFENETANFPVRVPSVLRNVVVKCELHKPDTENAWKKYIRHRKGGSTVEFILSDSEGYSVKGNFKYKNCYGILDSNDKCWHTEEPIKVLNWSDPSTPPMMTGEYNVLPEYPYLLHYSAGNAAEYIKTVMEINQLDNSNVYFELTDDIDFTGYPTLPMLGEESSKAFSGFLNGNGHKIKNMNISRTTANVGMIGYAADGVRIENLIIDSSCRITGLKNVGFVGSLQNEKDKNVHMTVRNFNSYATVKGTGSGEQSAGGLIGMTPGGNEGRFCMTLENVHIGGVVGDQDDNSSSHKNGALAGWFEGRTYNADSWDQSELKNVVVDCKLYGSASENKNKFIRNYNPSDKETKIDEFTYERRHIKFINCFGSYDIDDKDVCWLPLTLTEQLNEFPTLEGWSDNQTPGKYVAENNVEYLANNIGSRYPGTVATFFCPRNPYDAKENQLTLPFDEGEDEYVIAADFSQNYDVDKHLDRVNKVINAPLIAMRHIFRIRDGKVLADQLSGSKGNNEAFLKRNRKIVSARAGVPFQIRLSNPVPVENSAGRSNFYYKLEEDKYARVCEMDIKVLDAVTKEESSDVSFKFWEKFSGQGSREIDGVEYQTGDAGKEFYRMLECENPKVGSYIVQIIGKDDDGQRIKIFNTDEDLVVMEYEITFLPKQGASMLTEDDLYSKNEFKHARIEYLDENYGGPLKLPSTHIDFDEYIKAHDLDDADLKDKLVKIAGQTAGGMDKAYFKWPLPWEQSDYSFGYDQRHDYNMYMLATHSSQVPYYAAAEKWNNNAQGEEKGLFDRLYYRTLRTLKAQTDAQPQARAAVDGMKQGYFYYVNAATDPGVAARLNIKTLCPGSTIHVSAWIAEFSENVETANLAFNFVAVLNDKVEEEVTNYQELGLGNGARVTLHQFITGYVPSNANKGATSATAVNEDKRGEWLNIYYSFIPRQSDFLPGSLATYIDHYEVELDNNTKSSHGADYAIDDIRAYVEAPTVESRQLTPVCGNRDVRISIASPFDSLLEVAGEAEATSVTDNERAITIYYAFIDKELYDEKIKGADESEYNGIFDESLVAVGGNKYGSITFKSRYSTNPKYGNGTPVAGTAYRWTDEETGERLIVFVNELKESDDNALIPGKDYYIVMRTSGDGSPESGVAAFFAMEEDCTAKCEMTIAPSSIVKIDGVVETVKGRMVICENTSPIIQANVTGISEDGEVVDLKKNALFDWIYGSIEEFKEYGDGTEGHLLETALQVFRKKYPDRKDTEGVSADSEKVNGEEMLEQWMLDVIRRASTEMDENLGMPLLTLRQRSFVLPPVTIPEGEKEVVVDVVAIPLPLSDAEKPEKVIVCTEPSELSVIVGNKAPTLRHGFSGIEYPMTDVPLRIGLDQIREEKTDGFNMKTIEVPVRIASSPDKDVSELTRTSKEISAGKTKEGCIILVQSNDPDFADLGEPGEEGGDALEFPWVGEVTKLQASTAEGAKNYFQMRFMEDFDVKEGYYYKLRFEYAEKFPDNADNADNVICTGQDLLTLKIVPKYQLWTGGENLNWNNDANWSRLDASEINSGKKNGAHRHFLTDGIDGDNVVNGNKTSYAPLDFTYVVVKDGVESPYLYAPAKTKTITDNYGAEYTWPEDPDAAARASSDYSDYPQQGVGESTEMIQYDMAAMKLNDKGQNDPDFRCRPWYVNACREIHFKPGGTIMNQQLLTYGKAWVDVELDHSRWQTLSTPLQEVYSGDFYLPSDGARENGELFTEITFDNTLAKNHRFKPAVYQRSWDKGEAKVYELDASNNEVGTPRNVAVRTKWSHVYNDVEEMYGGGNGFSIKTDVSQMEKNVPKEGEKVLFRLPKNDGEYLYYTQDDKYSGHKTTIERTAGQYRLNETNGTLKATSASEGNYFLVGNPFMTHMDIKDFLNRNSDTLEKKYWIIANGSQIAAEADKNGEFIVANPADPEAQEDHTVVAPMQGFFVKTSAARTEVELAYDETMMRRYDSSADHSYLTGTTRSGSDLRLRVVAECGGVPSTAALLTIAAAADTVGHQGVEAIDNRNLDVPATVYTVGGGKALSIQSVAEAEGVEIGVIADDSTVTLLRFSGIDEAEGLMLLDKTDRSLTPIGDGTEVAVSGAVAGKLFLTYGIPTEGVMSGIEWSLEAGVLKVTDCAASGLLEVNVYDSLGRVVRHAVTDADTLTISLDKGIYAVEMLTLNDRETAKIRL